MKIRIARTAHDLVLSEAERAGDREACGLLVGQEALVEAVIPAANVAADPHRMFEVDPVILLSAHRSARQSGRLVIGHYHSHPGGRASPSLRDAANAHQEGVLWIIVGEGSALAAFRAKVGGEIAGRFDHVELEIV